jgi:hypothetical protein
MPNWVYNSVVVSGDKLELDKLKEQLNKPVTKHYPDHTYNKETEQWEDTPAIQQYSNPVFSFWNVIAPTDLDAYYGREKQPIDPDNIMLSIMEGFALGMDSYNWNVRNWGTKWDIAVEDGVQHSNTELEITNDGSLMYRFETAWSPVYEIFNVLSQEFPTLEFDYEYEEEQGWGGSATWLGGELVSQSEYHEPSSHADYVERGRGDSCNCNHEDDQEFWFVDCPREDEKELADNGWVEKQGVEV